MTKCLRASCAAVTLPAVAAQRSTLNLSHFWPLPLIPALLLPLPLSYNSPQIPPLSLPAHHCLSQGFGGVWELSLELLHEHTELRCWLPSQPALQHLQQPLTATRSLTTQPDPHVQSPPPWALPHLGSENEEPKPTS